MNLRTKSRTTSALLTVTFGPLGLFYSSAGGALLLMVIALSTVGTGIVPFICWGASIFWGDHTVRRHNESVAALLGRPPDGD